MKINETKFQKCFAAFLRISHTAWMLLKNCIHRNSTNTQVIPTATSTQSLSPLERITEYLRLHDLDQQVHVHFDADEDDFILEDDDGYVHAKDYKEAVLKIDRMWL